MEQQKLIIAETLNFELHIATREMSRQFAGKHLGIAASDVNVASLRSLEASQRYFEVIYFLHFIDEEIISYPLPQLRIHVFAQIFMRVNESKVL